MISLKDPAETLTPAQHRLRVERLVRRFAATIPYRKPLVVSYTHAMSAERLQATGLPAMVLPQVIYVTVKPGQMVAIPRSTITDIRPLYP